jgi:hypothetical protein
MDTQSFKLIFDLPKTQAEINNLRKSALKVFFYGVALLFMTQLLPVEGVDDWQKPSEWIKVTVWIVFFLFFLVE